MSIGGKFKAAGIIVFLLMGAVTSFMAAYYLEAATILPQVYIESINVGGLAPDLARAKIQPAADEILSHRVAFRYQGQDWEASLSELGVTIDLEAAVDRALQIGHEGSPFRRYREIRTARQNGYRVRLPISVNTRAVEGVVSSLTEELTVPAADATFFIDKDDLIQLTPAKMGARINTERAALELVRSIPFLRTNDREVILLSMEQVQPEVTSDDLGRMKIKGVLGSFSTRFNPGNVNRTYNLHVAADALNNQMVKPGAEFSFNEIVGPRSEEAGYKEALVIVNNQFVPGVGGGVCQVSTTLYNALLRGGLSVTERSNHSLVVPYVPPGLDATVAYGGLDLKFRNDTGSYLVIRTKINGDVLTIKLLGDTDVKKNVSIVNKVEQELPFKVVTKTDPNLYTGKEVVEQEGVKGYRAKVLRQFYENGLLVRTELVSHDVYKPIDKIVRMGTKPVDNPVPDQPPANPIIPPPPSVPPTPGTVPEDQGNTVDGGPTPPPGQVPPSA